MPRYLKIWIVISISCFLALCLTSGRGSQFVTLFFSMILLVYLVYFKNNNRNYLQIRLVKVILPVVLLGVVSYAFIMLENVGDNLASNKLQQFVSLFSAFGSQQGRLLDNISFSPYMRIAETLNILANGLDNPFCLLFGKGYGGYYTDSLGLFNRVDLYMGAFSNSQIKTGRFATAHSMYPNVLLFHGVLGFSFVCKLGIDYLRRVKYSCWVFAAFILLLYSLYFNVSLLIACILFLFAADYNLKRS